MKGYEVHIYKAADGWRWRMKSGNGKIVADSGEAYATKSGCKAGWRRVRQNTFLTFIVED